MEGIVINGQLQPILVQQFRRLCTYPDTKLRDVKELFERIVKLMGEPSNKDPRVVQEWYQKVFHPDLVAEAMTIMRYDIVKFCILKGALVKKEWKEYIVHLIPELEWAVLGPPQIQ